MTGAAVLLMPRPKASRLMTLSNLCYRNDETVARSSVTAKTENNHFGLTRHI